MEKIKNGEPVHISEIIAEVIEELESVREKLNEMRTDDGEDMRDENRESS